ncbi:MAG: hypothetical protein D6773_02350, partial [Alphaproteobacteria bacterium]
HQHGDAGNQFAAGRLPDAWTGRAGGLREFPAKSGGQFARGLMAVAHQQGAAAAKMKLLQQ